ncbi:MAG: hypothetical protein WCQ49_02935 [Candidatus Saccharibacteria bacterium]
MDNQSANKESSSLMDKINKDVEEMKKYQDEKIKEAKELMPDKELFDINKLAESYDLTNESGQLRITPEMTREFEAYYYIDKPDIKSIKEFADYLTFIESNSTN